MSRGNKFYGAAGPVEEGSALRTADLVNSDPSEVLQCDVLIIGGGPAGLTVARGLDGSRHNILILESGGFEETPEAESLNAVEVSNDTWTETQAARRAEYHASLTRHWDPVHQGYGVRCRGLGGSTASWAGKSAAFDDIDFAARSWVPNSGWPISLQDLKPALDRAARTLNLGPNCYDDALWGHMGRDCPLPRPDETVLRSFFWQFARSTIDPMAPLNAGAEFLKDSPTSCRIITGATVLEIDTDVEGQRVTQVRVADRLGKQRRVDARCVVLAASAIENARLLLASRRAPHVTGVGNAHGNVGRYLMDHPCAVVARFGGSDITRMADLFGFYGLKAKARVTMYMRGLAPTPEVQEEQGLLNCAGFMPGERACDDPWDAAKRILRRKSDNYGADALAILRSPGLVTQGLGRLALQSPYMPPQLSSFVVDQIIRFRPNMAAEAYLTNGVPHKFTSLDVQVVCEQVPDRDNRITLSDRTDRFGVPLPRARWQVGLSESRTLACFGKLLTESFAVAGMPVPVLEPWIAVNRPDEARIIDMGHTSGTTRMSADPRHGVVDANCRVHGMRNLFIAGASVFPTSGHANPTLMIVALSSRLADHIEANLSKIVRVP